MRIYPEKIETFEDNAPSTIESVEQMLDSDYITDHEHEKLSVVYDQLTYHKVLVSKPLRGGATAFSTWN